MSAQQTVLGRPGGRLCARSPECRLGGGTWTGRRRWRLGDAPITPTAVPVAAMTSQSPHTSPECRPQPFHTALWPGSGVSPKDCALGLG